MRDLLINVGHDIGLLTHVGHTVGHNVGHNVRHNVGPNKCETYSVQCNLGHH